MKEKILKGKVTKRLLSVVLALAMILTLMPQNSMTVYAEGESSSESSIGLKYAFIPMFMDGKVKVVNTENHQEVKTIAVGTQPNSAAVTGDGKYCLVTNRKSGSVSVIDVATFSVIKTITGISNAEGIGFSDDNTCAYVASSYGIYKIEIGGTWNKQLTNFKNKVNLLVVAGNKIYTMNENDEKLYVVDPENDFSCDTKTIKKSFGLSTAVDGKSVYLGQHNFSSSQNVIQKVDTASGEITDIQLSKNVLQPVFDFSEDGKYLYIVDFNAQIIKYDLENGNEEQYTALQGYETCYSCGITLDQKYLYILSYNQNKLVVVDTSSLEKVTECDVNRPFLVGSFMATGRTVRLYKEKYSHTHAWNYEVDRNEISVYCSSTESSENCAANGSSSAKTLTLSAPSDLTYNGQKKAATVTGQEEFVELTGATVGDINYEGVGETGYTKQTTAPTDAGTYNATVTVTAANGTPYTATKQFTIAKANATCSVTGKNNLTYNGKEQDLVTSTKNGCTIYYRVGENGEWSTTVPKAKNAGTYDIYYYGLADENHNSVGSAAAPKGPVSVTIAKKPLNAEMITIAPASKVFDDEPTRPEVTVSDMVDSTQCITVDDYEISGADVQEEVGDYTITVTAKEEGNYSGSAQKIWSITGASFGENDITVTPYEVDYDGAAHGIDIALSGDAEGAEITYSETESGTYTTTNPTYKDVKTIDGGTYTVYYKVNKRGYYEKKGSSTVKIKPKQVSVTWGDASFTYNGRVQAPVATVTESDGLIAEDECNVTVTGGKTDSNKKAGNTSYTATADSLDNTNYKLPETKPTTDFTIAPLEIGIAWGETAFTYNGSEQKPAATATGLVGSDRCILTVGGEKKDVGSYTATVTALSDDNYQLPLEMTTDFTITPKALTESHVSVSVTGGDNGGNTSSFIWDGNYKKPTITVTDNETGENVTLVEDIDYILKGNTEEVDVSPAGSPYRIILTGDGNYTGKRAVTWTIVKKPIAPVVTIDGWTYGETPKTPALSGVTLKGDVTYTYYTDAECTKKTTTAANGADEEGGVPTFAGIYYVKAVVAETDYYDETASAAVSFTIAKKAVTVTPKAGQTKTYGDKDPGFTYDVALLEGDTLSGSLTREVGEDAGTYKIKRGTLDNANYDITVDENVDFTIEPKKLTADMISVSPLSYQYDGSKQTATYAYHDKTVQVEGTGVTVSDVTYKGNLTGTLCGQYTVRIVGQNNYTGTISKNWFISPVTDVTVSYDAAEHRIAVADNLTDVSVKFYNEETKEYDIALSDIESLPTYTMPGVYEYKYRMVVDEGTDFEETADGTALLTIKKLALEDVTVSIAESIGYGNPVAPSVLSNGQPITGVDVTYYYKKQSEGDNAYTTTVPTDRGDYTVKAVIPETECQKGGTATADFSIIPGTLDRFDPGIGYYRPTDSGEKTVSLWPDYKMLDGVSYEVGAFDDKGIIGGASVSPDGDVSYTLTGTGTVDATVVIPVTIKSTNYNDLTVDVKIIVDATAPTGSVSIKDTSNSWTDFINNITFGLFFKNNQKVTITGSDNNTKVYIWYYVSDEELTLEAVKAIADTEWTALPEDETVSIQKGKQIVYAKLKDRVGNTTYLSSDGSVIYEDAAGVTTAIEYVKKSENTATAKVDLKGNTIKDVAIVSGETTTALTKDTDYTVSEGNITFTNTYLETLAVSETPYTFKVSYHPAGETYVSAEGNDAPSETEISLTVKKNDGTVTLAEGTVLDKAYDGQTVTAPEFTTTNTRGESDANVKVEYKKADAFDSAYVTDAPKDAGTYKIRITVQADADYTAAVLEKEFTISPKTVTAVITANEKSYDGKAAVEVTATVNTGIEGETLTVTGLTGTAADAEGKADANAAAGKNVAVDSTKAQVTAGEGTHADNYKVEIPAESSVTITKAPLKLKVEDASKHIGTDDPDFTYRLTEGTLVEGDTITGITYDRTAGESAGTYAITATEEDGENPNYDITIEDGSLTIEAHTEVVDEAVEATCTETGLTEGKHCSVCNEVLVAQEEVAAKGHTEVVDEAVEATCTTAGKTAGKHCSVCNEVLVAQEEVAAKGHTEVVDEAVEATCTETGLTAGKHCSVCNEVLVAQKEVAAKGHTEVVDEAVEATCTTAGKTAGKHCSVCEEVLVAQETVAALGHDWSGEWTIVKEATATTDGKRETICTRDGCGQKKYETIPATGTPEEPENPNAGKLDKDAEVEPDAPIDEATLDNKKSELLDAPAIFTEAEKQQIQSGTDARVWLDVKRTDESSIPTEDKKEVTKEAEKIMGENPMITYFDADLFKQVEGGDKTQIHEPGIDIQVTILIPDELLNHDRTMVREYKIIRLHYDAVTGESKVDVLSGDFDRGTGEFSFKTDKFSTFAIAYTDIQLVTGITLTADSATLTGSGETVQLTATVAPDNAVNKNVIWTSSDPNVATVDANGKVAAVGNGTCTITATTEDGSYTAICTIKVEIPDSDNGGNNGDNNSGDNNQSNEDANTPANTKEDKKPNVEAPKTGDAGNVTLWSLLFALSALALAGIRVARRKRSSSIEK